MNATVRWMGLTAVVISVGSLGCMLPEATANGGANAPSSAWAEARVERVERVERAEPAAPTGPRR